MNLFRRQSVIANHNMGCDMATYTVDTTLRFIFPETWKVTKCDEWAFYRNQFSKVRQEKNNGIKCVDLLAISADKTLWLIEAKDYRHHRRQKTIPPFIELRDKVFDTLAMLPPAACNATGDENVVARKAMKAKRLRIVFHYEQPRQHSKLFPIDHELVDMQIKIKKCIKSIDPHPIVMDINSKPAALPWTVE